MRKTDDKLDPDAPDWWTARPDENTKNRWKMAVDDYLIAEDAEPEDVEHDMDMAKDCIKWAKKYDSRWKGFNKANFNISRYPAHKFFYDLTRNRLDTLKSESERTAKAEKQKIKKAQEQHLQTAES